ncbi:MAG: branched-chain amino acid transport system II carrier protein [Desulfobacteraceae bacterium]|nr:branched-chain amino acid transport system II carrier protein [Desulfobacteraceae bacterium]
MWRLDLVGKEKKDVAVVGAALFAMFFGAGNLIFPSALGFHAGDNWLVCVLGFFMTGVGLPILGVIAVAKNEGSFDRLAGKVSPGFAKLLGAVIVLSIGPFLAIPRTGATVYEIGVKPLFQNMDPLLVSAIFFSITLLFALRPSGVVDKIGKYLTPLLLLIISMIVIKGVAAPMGIPVDTGFTHPFSKGFSEGYQTMDALASILFGGLVLASLGQKGYTDPGKQINMACHAGLIAGLGLMFVYGGLLYLGATGSGSNMFQAGITKADLLITITNTLFGPYGRTAMCIAVSAACLTTSIGLTAVVGNYFEKESKGKLSYRLVVLVTTAFSMVISVCGIENIIKFSIPLLVIAYPVVIVLIVLTIASRKISSIFYRGAVTGALVVSVFDALAYLKIDTGLAGKLISKLPFYGSDFSWVIPAFACALLMELVMKITKKAPIGNQPVNNNP